MTKDVQSTDASSGSSESAESRPTVPRIAPASGGLSSMVERAKSETMPVWVLLPLRAFLGFTFVFAGLQKLANRQFFTAGAPGSIQLQLQASAHTSPVRFLVNLALHAPVAFGIAIALAEVAIGLGISLGLLGRIAAGGGMLLSLLFFLTVSFNTWPYYFGSDIVFLFAWTPLLLAGSGPLSLDAVLQGAIRRKAGAPSDAPLEGDLGRRALLRQIGAAGVVGTVGLFAAGITAAIGRAVGHVGSGTNTAVLQPPSTTSRSSTATSNPGSATTSPSSTTGTTNPPGTAIGRASAVPVGGAASFTNPTNQGPAYVVRPSTDKFVAFSAVCTHQGCTVGFQGGSSPEFVCPCHGSVYNALTGQVIQGPAVQSLPQIQVTEGSNGDLFAS